MTMHVVTGVIRKEPYVKEGSNNNGSWKMYAVDLSERMKIRNRDGQDETVYTNYRAVLFAKESMIKWYDEALQMDKVISVTCRTLQIVNREHNGTIYSHNEMIMPQLEFSQRDPSQSGGGNQQTGWGKPQQPNPQQAPKPQNSGGNAGMDFDDDIPF
ncbi:putative single-stranded DNA binding protein [Klebsiella phage pKP-BS317-1.1]|nr:putative single-stranded DNA binding protein [Klebsiella phage pKP-BS317-1.1]